ncbi:C10 family peptidase, partial [bacterium]|nr:C10 family peptidase [bacterium]
MSSWKGFASLFLVVLIVFANYGSGFCQLTPANPQAAVAVANNWLRLGQEVEWGWTTAADFTPASIQKIEYQGQLVGFALPIIGGGYIITPAYQELPPITAYSTVSSFDANREDGFCEMMKEVLSDKILLVTEYLTNPNPPAEWHALQDAIEHHRDLWQAYTADYGTFTKAVRDENFRSRIDSENQTENPYGIMSVDPLLTCSWHQGDPYNQFCPMGDGGRCVVGCVATATAQILYYHKSPSSGIGSYTYWWNGDNSCGGSTPGESLSVTLSDPYDWENILDRYDGGETQAQEDAVAELCYEVGVAEDMMYGRCGSGAYVSNAVDAFEIHFGYSGQIDYQERASYGSPEEWFSMLVAELNQLRPMQYFIYAHSIVCDGWRVSGANQVHMNYGWDSSHNTWYTVDELYCPWEGCSKWVEGAIRRIIPPSEIIMLK